MDGGLEGAVELMRSEENQATWENDRDSKKKKLI